MTQPIRVLLVEDNPADADLTRETLEMSKLRLDIDTVEDGAEALSLLSQRAEMSPGALPDLILLDLNLPKVNGREVLAAIRRHEVLRHIPVVVLTSSNAEADIVKSYEIGANCYVTKPVGLEAFREIVGSVERFWFTVVRLP